MQNKKLQTLLSLEIEPPWVLASPRSKKTAPRSFVYILWIHFQINNIRVIRTIKWNKLTFPSFEINKPPLAWVHSVS